MMTVNFFEVTRESKLAELRKDAEELEYSIYELAYECIEQYYEAAGFTGERLIAQLDAMSEEELIETYLVLWE